VTPAFTIIRKRSILGYQGQAWHGLRKPCLLFALNYWEQNLSAATIYLDESGDLGWELEKPYPNGGGSSRFFTIAAVICDSREIHLIKRLLKKFLVYLKSPHDRELKWVNLKFKNRIYFCHLAAELKGLYPNSVHYYSITVYKRQVPAHIRSDSDKLYNYMIGLSLLPKMCEYKTIDFIPDWRNLNVNSDNSLTDYLQIQLWFEKDVATIVHNHVRRNSISEKGLQFADLIAGAIQQYYEDNCSEYYQILKNCTEIKQLYFPNISDHPKPLELMMGSQNQHELLAFKAL